MSAISEGQRRRMYEAFVAQFGEEVADTVMGHLPPVGWADVATKQDLVHLREVLEARMDALSAELRAELRAEVGGLRSEFRGDMARQTRWFVGATVGAIIAVSGLPQVLAGVAMAGAQ